MHRLPINPMIFVLCAALALSGCNARGGKVPYNPSSFSAPDAKPLPTLTADYHLGPGDVVTVRIYNVQHLSGDYPIDTLGRISMPLIGSTQAAGYTSDQLAARLTSQLGSRYLNSPSVSVIVKTAVQKTLTVDGSVGAPGIYPVQMDTTLIQAIALARGTAEGANPKRVVVFRQINGQRQAAAFDLTTIRRGIDPDPKVYPDDVIVVDGSATNSALRNVLQAIPLFSVFRPF